jgi:ABC-type uncharacterized transport system permease subunit
MTMGFLSGALIGYILAIVLAVLNTVYRSTTARRAASLLFVATWMAHSAAVIRQGVATGGIPLSNMAEYLLVFGWALLTLHMYLWFGAKVHVAGLVLPPLAALAAFFALQLHPVTVAHPASRADALFLFHTTISTVGMAFLGVSFAMSLLYLVQDRALKARKRLVLLERLPSLERCDQIGHRALVFGFVLLSLGIGTGLVINTEIHRQLWIWSAKTTFPILAWLVFAAILIARTALGFRGRKSAYLTITGFALGVLTVIGMTL